MMSTSYLDAVKFSPSKRKVLKEIIELGPELAEACGLYRSHEAVTRTSRSLGWWKFLPLHRRRWRITNLYNLPPQHSLWIGSNGKYYLGTHQFNNEKGKFEEYPAYWYEAPIHKRSQEAMRGFVTG